MSAQLPAGPRLVGGHGPRAVEAALLADLDRLLPHSLEALRDDPRPILLVVPSRSLRLALLARVAQTSGGAVGLEIATLRRTARAILEQGGLPEPRGEALFDLLLHRAAAAEASLQRTLGDLVDGIDSAVASMRDLVDAGFEPELAPALDEALAVEAPRDEASARARALVRATAAAIRAARRLGIGGTADLYRSARELLLEHGPAALPARAVLVYGFADATGVATDFVTALVSGAEARVYLDLAGTTAPSPGSMGRGFGRSFRERLLGVAPLDPNPVTGDPSSPTLLTLENPRREVREVGRRALALIARGVAPERIGVVARDLSPYVSLLRTEWDRLGIPFSGEASWEIGGPEARRLDPLLDLVERREGAPIERWLGWRSVDGVVPFDLRTALRLLGVVRLEQIAAIDAARDLPPGDFPLPIRQGLEAGDLEGGPSAPRRRLPRTALVGALTAGRSLLRRLREWPGRTSLSSHLRALERLRSTLGPLARAAPGESSLDAARAALLAETPPELELDQSEFARLLRRALLAALETPLGGRGGGVQVLSVTEARGRTFAHLFLLGLNTGNFPRTVSEDPVLPDRIRTFLAPLLPDLPRKLEGRDEERVLFGQLLLASPETTLLHARFDAHRRPLTPSPLLGGFASPALSTTGEHSGEASPEEPTSHALDELPPEDAVLVAALAGPRPALEPFLAAALPEHAEAGQGRPTRLALASAHLALLDEIDPDLSTESGRERRHHLGPFFGFVGAVTLDADPRRRQLAVTSLEALCACPWRHFVERLLRLDLPPDEAEELPRLDAARLGRIVHAVLERLVPAEAGSPALDLTTAPTRPATPVVWPDDLTLSELARQEAERLLAEDGLARWPLSRAEAARALPYLRAARDVDRGRFEALATEAQAEMTLPIDGVPRRLGFRVDRLERLDGRLVLTDFKTGKPELTRGSDTARRKAMLQSIATGRRLQAALYARASADDRHEAGPSASALGRYVYLGPGLEVAERQVDVAADDAEAAAALERAVAAGMDARDRGAFFPRLLDPRLEKSADVCSFCRVAASCLQHDSGARLRLAERLTRLRGGEVPVDGPAEASLAMLYDLGQGIDRERR